MQYKKALVGQVREWQCVGGGHGDRVERIRVGAMEIWVEQHWGGWPGVGWVETGASWVQVCGERCECEVHMVGGLDCRLAS